MNSLPNRLLERSLDVFRREQMTILEADLVAQRE